jgi:hypothetical protein
MPERIHILIADRVDALVGVLEAESERDPGTFRGHRPREQLPPLMLGRRTSLTRFLARTKDLDNQMFLIDPESGEASIFRLSLRTFGQRRFGSRSLDNKPS